MYPNPINLSNGSETLVFDSRGGELNASLYKAPAAGGLTLSDEPSLEIKHMTTNPNAIGEKRKSLIRLNIPVKDSAGNRDVQTIALTVTTPVRICQDLDAVAGVTLMKSFLTTATFIDKLVAGQIGG